MRSLFIVIDGADGVGKSTLAAALHERIEGSVLTREPGGCPGSEEIRGVFLSHHWTPMAELYLLAAGRAQHISDVILPALDAGKTVICDRWTHSTLAYQGVVGGLALGSITAVMSTMAASPDLTFIVDAPDDVIDARLQRRSTPTRPRLSRRCRAQGHGPLHDRSGLRGPAGP